MLNFWLVRKKLKKKKIPIEHMGTKFMLVDPLTEGLIPKVFHEHIAHMGH